MTGLGPQSASLWRGSPRWPRPGSLRGGHPDARGINQRAGLIAMEYGKYDETARYFRRMEELSEQLAAAEPDEPLKVKASVKATLGDFQMDRIGDAAAALKYFDQAAVAGREWTAREPANHEAKRRPRTSSARLARARLRLGDPVAARGCIARRSGSATGSRRA